MAEYLKRDDVLASSEILTVDTRNYGRIDVVPVEYLADIPSADVQEKKYCKMIPLEPDCRDCTDVFICTNCHQHIHLGFIRKEYSGSYCLECGAEVKEGEQNDNQ